ncbi:MAG TPA: site-2 protease family protein [Pyrinomonadaceae bacterium]|nr:site-2 protease family protein [Pyrinomonadaceae bacterium]
MENLNDVTNQLFDRREAMRPTMRTWAKHAALLLAALFTVTIAGVLEPFGFIPIFPEADPQTWTEILRFLVFFPIHYLQLIFSTIGKLATEFETLKYGLSFSLSLLAILTAHEAGHYVACRLYKVDATLPYFIPLPPLLGPAGTLGAFIKIVSPLPSRRAAFDIGVAGPIAGFITIIPVAVIGLLTMEQISPDKITGSQAGIYFADPLFIQLLGKVLGVDSSLGFFNPFLAAAWIGLLVTSLNLIPSGQLDGGHAIYAVFGETVHRWTGRIAFVAMVAISICGWIFYSSPSGILFTILLAVMLKVRHPEPLDDAPLNSARLLIAVLTLVIFVLSFVPFPVQVR